MENPKSFERAPTPYEQLTNKARAKLEELFPDVAAKIQDGDKEPVVEGFVADMLTAAGISGSAVFHRLDTNRQKQELGEHDIDSLFAHPTAELVEYYRTRLNSQKKAFDPLTDSTVEDM